MTYHLDDTIAAIATAPGGAARSMVRVSGPDASAIIAGCFRAEGPAELESRGHAAARSGVAAIHFGEGPRQIPCTLFYWPNRSSYTREPVAEFHTLGSPPVVQALLDAICRAGARLAEPGEFTLRAFLAGRLDLTQAEAVLGVIDAHDAADLRSAVNQLAGNLARPLGQLREELLLLLADLEAGLDFVEEDIEFISARELSRRLQVIASGLVDVANMMTARSTSNVACQIALVGAPNAGKSSLFNALVSRFGIGDEVVSSAIVSDIRGTTRDYLAAQVEFAGLRCELIDTAGIDERELNVTEIDAKARNQAAERCDRSLVRMVCVDATAPDLRAQLVQANETAAEMIVITKIDQLSEHSVDGAPNTAIFTSSLTGRGLNELAEAITQRLMANVAAIRTGCVAATANRCGESIRQAGTAVAEAAVLAVAGSGDELVAAEIRVALAELGKVVGVVYTDDLLDRIFKTFCIGK